MTELRDYPPRVIVHEPHCVDRGNAPALPRDVILREYPGHLVDPDCGPINVERSGPGALIFDVPPYGVVQPIPYPTHDWVPGEIFPADAVRALCRTCGSTHPPDL